MAEVAAFSTIAVPVFSLVAMAFHRSVKPVFGLLDLIADFRQIGYFERSAVLIDEVLERNAMKAQITIEEIKTFLGEIICLLNKVKITILHSSGWTVGDGIRTDRVKNIKIEG
jgi:hypothetical protein